MKRIAVVIALSVFTLLGASAEGDQTPALRPVMQEKLTHAQAILAAVVTSDWARLDRESRALAMVTREPAWMSLTAPEHLRQSDAFMRALQDLIKASARRDYDAAATADLSLTKSCLECHKHVALSRLAK